MDGLRLRGRDRDRVPEAEIAAVRAHAEPLPDIEDPAFGAMFDRFADARVVLLGEATHGTSEFYRARAAITRRLIERHGFTIVAVEADWPDAAHIDAFVRGRERPTADGPPFTRFPTWMWRNAEVHAFITWLHAHNRELPAERRIGFRGLDIYSLGGSIATVLQYLDRVDPEEARDARGRYGCLSPWLADPGRYGRAVLNGDKKPCAQALLDQLNELLENRLAYARLSGEEDFFDAVQNARIARAAEHYYRVMYQGSTESWNLRDRHMFDTLERLLAAGGAEARAVVWAHNSHIGNATATAMGWQGEFNIGELCRIAYRDGAVLIGFGTDRGTVAAADDWDEPMRVKNVLPARADSHERVFREAGLPAALTDWRQDAELRQTLSASRLERAIGVVYRPQSELASHYFEAVLPEQFDAFVWFEKTKAVTPLPVAPQRGGGDLYPFGL
ncbi:erythromycin esterase family protein [Enterovirga aerilata]|uniref:Erythromycin esterase family protein n=1 Tax=Enterovirga aerilata TaxID=2730920 RepID=A0A849I5U0_9HYPH|nr:erythromycin esterase family protein [Enterovirga sp. DB1703]NNM71407.1 erythromycin esterase family protein [Enterovirga sp. DB1703]